MCTIILYIYIYTLYTHVTYVCNAYGLVMHSDSQSFHYYDVNII